MSDDISFQTWICPSCHGDHPQGNLCTPEDDRPFTPSQDDRSYIADQYRALQAQLADARAELELLRRVRERAFLLREAQRAYMANRGNDTLGAAVGHAAAALDAALREWEARGK